MDGSRSGNLALFDLELPRSRVSMAALFARNRGRVLDAKLRRIVRELGESYLAFYQLTGRSADTLQFRELVSGEFVFPGPEGKPLVARYSNDALEEICEQLGVRRLHNHVLRHTFASHAVMCSVPMRQVQEWLGHGSMDVTMRYAHLSEGIGDELIRRLAPPQPTSGSGTHDDAAQLQHMDGAQIRRSPNSASQTHNGARF